MSNSTTISTACTTIVTRRPRRFEAARRQTLWVTVLAVFAALLLVPQPAGAASTATTSRSAIYASYMLGSLNYSRKVNHLRPLGTDSRLVLSAHRHNLAMAAKNSLSHRLPGEAFFADRIARAGYQWVWAGENIGWTSDQTVHGLIVLEKLMYAERPPNNGHRLNILSTHFAEIGIDVLFDTAHHKIWFTQNFGLVR